ncbi:hypothetical protein HKD28_12280 [Gluconobacter sp. LMG 1744]|uniref:hypothetical protein n=1 Tax=Gluconobacter cadivus TaxID=2728101 RepID=UPI001884B2DA|nr:hypothetical protein [Gluconobacter cadivus]MBF0892178.1 hypothetical protein [Gluconobacter cadivus]
MNEPRIIISLSPENREFYPQFGFEIFSTLKRYALRVRRFTGDPLDLQAEVEGGSFIVPDDAPATVTRLRIKHLDAPVRLGLDTDLIIEIWNLDTGEVVTSLPHEFLTSSKIKNAEKEMRSRKRHYGITGFTLADYHAWRVERFPPDEIEDDNRIVHFIDRDKGQPTD